MTECAQGFFDGDFFGNEGFKKTLWLYGAGLSNILGQPAYYSNGQELLLKIHFQGDRFRFLAEGVLIAEGSRKSGDKIAFSLRAGDDWSKGTTDFWDFELRPASKEDLETKGNLIRTAALGGNGGWGFGDIPKGQALLLGFNLKVTKFPLIGSLEPVYLYSDGEFSGSRHGYSGRDKYSVKARPGYAVGGLIVKPGDLIDGFKIVFMRIDNGRLDPKDSYESRWYGGRGGGPETPIGGDGRPVIGVHGRSEAHLNAIGLIQLETIGELDKKPHYDDFERLITKLKLGRPSERIEAANSLAKLGGKRAIEPLIASLKYGPDDKRMTVIKWLGKMGDKRAVEPIIAALESKDDHMKTAAAEALGELGDKRAVEPLITALEHTDRKHQIAVALSKLGDPRAVRALVQHGLNYRFGNLAEIGAIGPGAKPVLIALLRDKDEKIRQRAAAFLKKLGWPPEKVWIKPTTWLWAENGVK